MIGKKAGIVFTLCLVACFVLPGMVDADKSSLHPAAPPTKTLTALHTKPPIARQDFGLHR